MPLVERFLAGHVTGARHWTVRQQRHDTRLRERHRFVEELPAIAHRRVFPVPVAPHHARERTLAVRSYLSPDNLRELAHRPGLPVNGDMLGHVELQALDVLLKRSHVRIRSRSRCTLSRR